MQLTFSLGFFLAVLFFSVFSGKYDGHKIERSIRFLFSNKFIHLHHWMIGLLFLLVLFILKSNISFLYGLGVGTVFQGLCYRDRFVIFYEKENFDKIYSKWKR